MTRTEEFVVLAIVVACTVGRLFYQARGGTRLHWTRLRGTKPRGSGR